MGCSVWKTSVQKVESREAVLFDGITLNEGGYYQPLTGEYTGSLLVCYKFNKNQ